MTLTAPSSQRPFPVSLRQVPADVRFSAAQRAARTAGSSDEACDLIAAAAFPSATVYYVADSARELVERWAA